MQAYSSRSSVCNQLAGVLLAAVALPGCGSPGRPRVPDDDAGEQARIPQCTIFKREPTKPDLMAWDAGQRVEVQRLLRFGVVAVHYEQVGCDVTITVQSDCVGNAKYLYSPTYIRERVVVNDEQDAIAKLPLGAASLRGELTHDNSVRIDYVLAGQYALAPGQRVAGWDRPECRKATHYARSVHVGGFAHTSGNRDVVRAAVGVFGMGGEAGAKNEKLQWRTEGSPKACQEAEQQREENTGCNMPLRLELVAIPGRAPIEPEGAEEPTLQTRPRPHIDCPPGMAAIPAGRFRMGSEEGDDDEKPVHSVRLGVFCMDITEVTVAQYARCVDEGACRAARSGGYCNAGSSSRQDHPINCVERSQAVAYCSWAGKRLPTEEEWEYAARGADGRKYPWGNGAPDSRLCWKRYHWDSDETKAYAKGTCAVGSYPSGASPFGLLDMAGNVDEWTATDYCDSYAATKKCSDPESSYPRGVARGGNWMTRDSREVRSSAREETYSADTFPNDTGFRCAR